MITNVRLAIVTALLTTMLAGAMLFAVSNTTVSLFSNDGASAEIATLELVPVVGPLCQDKQDCLVPADPGEQPIDPGNTNPSPGGDCTIEDCPFVDPNG